MQGVRLKWKKRIAIAWLLMVMFVPQLAVKSVHIHHDEHHCEAHTPSSQGHEQSCNDCAICHFTLSYSTPAEFVSFSFLTTSIGLERFAFHVSEAHTTLLTQSLRAPPYC